MSLFLYYLDKDTTSSFQNKFVLCKTKRMTAKTKRFELDDGALFKSVASLWASVLLPLLIVFSITYYM